MTDADLDDELDDIPPVASEAEAVAMLTHGALALLWGSSDFQPQGCGCCHVCCAPCAALHWLDVNGRLDAVLDGWADAKAGDSMFGADGLVDREWMRRQWSGSKVQEQCGHRLDA